MINYFLMIAIIIKCFDIVTPGIFSENDSFESSLYELLVFSTFLGKFWVFEIFKIFFNENM